MLDATTCRSVVLIGGGHSHVQVLKILASEIHKCEGVRVTLISDNPVAWYSGMLPACIAGLYKPKELQIDLQALAHWCKTEWICARVTGIDVHGHRVLLDNHDPVHFDILSINIGSVTKGTYRIPGAATFGISTRPIAELLRKIELFEENFNEKTKDEVINNNNSIDRKIHLTQRPAPRVVVVGAGAAGIELSLAFHARFSKKYGNVSVVLVNSTKQIASEFGWWVSHNVATKLKQKSIHVINERRCYKVDKDFVYLTSNTDTIKSSESHTNTTITNHTQNVIQNTTENESTHVTNQLHSPLNEDLEDTKLPYDLLIWSTGPEALPVLQNFGIQLCNGFVEVLETLQSVSHPHIFAVGDCATIRNCPWVSKAGVFAVREGPILATNLLNLLRGKPLIKYSPQKGFLALLMTGDEEAISSWKGTSFRGRWVWYLKDKIDRNFMQKFDVKKLPAHSHPPNCSLCHEL